MAFVYDWLTQRRGNRALIYSDYKGVFNTVDPLNKQLSNLQLLKNTVTFLLEKKVVPVQSMWSCRKVKTEELYHLISHTWENQGHVILNIVTLVLLLLYSSYLRNCKRAVSWMSGSESPWKTSTKIGLVWICKSTTLGLMASSTILLTIWMKYTKEILFRIELV